MHTRQTLLRHIPEEARDALREAIYEKNGTKNFLGIVSDENGYALLFENGTPAQEQNDALQLALKFDTDKRTEQQIQQERQKQAYNDAIGILREAVGSNKPLTLAQTTALLQVVLHMVDQ